MKKHMTVLALSAAAAMLTACANDYRGSEASYRADESYRTDDGYVTQQTVRQNEYSTTRDGYHRDGYYRDGYYRNPYQRGYFYNADGTRAASVNPAYIESGLELYRP